MKEHYDSEHDEKGFNSFYDEFHFLIGKIVVELNLIESKIIMIICNMLDANDIRVGFVVCKRLSVTSLLDMLSDLIKKKIFNESTLQEFDILYENLKKVINQRNIYMHSVYFSSSTEETKLNRNIKRVRRVGLRELGKGEKTVDSFIIYELKPLRAIVQWLNSISEEIEEFCKLLSEEIPIKSIKFEAPEEPQFLKDRDKKD